MSKILGMQIIECIRTIKRSVVKQPKASEVKLEVEVELEADLPSEVGTKGSTATTRRSGAYHGPT